MLLPPNVLKAALAFTSKDETRYQLNGAYIERVDDSHVAITSTDGKRLFSATVKEDNWQDYPAAGVDAKPRPDFKAIVPNAALKAFSRPVKGLTVNSILRNVALDESSDVDIKMGATDLDTKREETTKAIEGCYPDYKVAFPGLKMRPIVTVRLNPYNLADCAKALCDVAYGAAPTVLLHIYAPDLPVEFHSQSEGVDARGMVMPLVVDEGKTPTDKASDALDAVTTIIERLDTRSQNIARKMLAKRFGEAKTVVEVHG